MIISRSLSLAVLSTFFAVDARGQAPRIRDSSGVRIVENPARLTAPIAFKLGDKPSFDVGGLESDPANEINSRQGYFKGIRLSNGHVAVIDQSRIHLFDAVGKRLRISGREGSGPGEFRQVQSLCRTLGDTILVAQGRWPVSILDRTGAFVANSPYGENGYAEGQFCFDDGTYFVMSMLPGDYREARTMRLTRLKLDGAVANRVADVVYPAFDPLLSNEPAIRAWGQKLYFGNGLTHDIHVFTAGGRLSGIIRTSDSLRPITPDEREKLQPTAYRAGSTEAERKADAARIQAASKTKNWPTHKRMFVDLSGRLWVEDWAPFSATGGGAWTAFDVDGRLLGRLVIPGAPSREKAVYVVQFGRDEVFLRRFDDDGAIHLTAYPLVPVKK
jgi:hypothetical protein